MIDPLIFPLLHEFAIREVVENLSFRSSGTWTFTNLIRILHSKGVRGFEEKILCGIVANGSLSTCKKLPTYMHDMMQPINASVLLCFLAQPRQEYAHEYVIKRVKSEQPSIHENNLDGKNLCKTDPLKIFSEFIVKLPDAACNL